MSLNSVFEQGWEGQDTTCGWGSQLEHTENIRYALPDFVRNLDIKTINDAGCGDFWWMRKVTLGNIDYMGYDIYDRRKGHNFPFTQLDIVKQNMRTCDLILCRDVFIHLPNDMVIEALARFSSVGRYLLSTTFNNVSNENRMELPQLKHCKINLRTKPFNLGEGIGCVSEDSPNKYMVLWDLQ